VSKTPGFVTKRDGRLETLPDGVKKATRWLWGVSLAMPVVMLLSGLFSHQAALPGWAGILLGILPFGIVITALVWALREGRWGNGAFAGSLVFLNFIGMTLEPYTATFGEMIMTRGVPIAAIVVTLSFLQEDLRYNLRTFWYNVAAMRQLQEQMMKMKAAKEAKKSGKPFDPNKVMDAEAMVRELSAKTGQEIPKHMAGGISMKPGFRQEKKDTSRKGNGASRQRRSR
jgi:hypothetical protein